MSFHTTNSVNDDIQAGSFQKPKQAIHHTSQPKPEKHHRHSPKSNSLFFSFSFYFIAGQALLLSHPLSRICKLNPSYHSISPRTHHQESLARARSTPDPFGTRHTRTGTHSLPSSPAEKASRRRKRFKTAVLCYENVSPGHASVQFLLKKNDDKSKLNFCVVI